MHDHELLNEEERRIAVSMLAGRPLAESREELFRAMGDPNWRVRKEAVEVFLGNEILPRDIHDLVSLLREESNAGLRNAASETLERLGSKAVPILLEHLSDKDSDLRKFIVDILGAIADRTALPHLLDLLQDPDPNVAAASVEALGKMDDPSVIPRLMEAIDSSDLCLTFTILDTLGRLQTLLPLEPLIPLLGNPLLRKAVYDCLGCTGDISVVPLLLEGLHERGRSIRDAALTALVRVHDRLPQDDRLKFLSEVQTLAGSSLVESLVTSIESVDGAMRNSLIRFLGMVRDSRALIPILRLSSIEEYASSCRWAIGEIGSAGVSTLTSFFPFASDEEQITIIGACVEMGSRQCGDILRDGASSANPAVREAAVRGAGELRLESLVDVVVAALDDADPSVMRSAVGALVHLAPSARERVHDEASRRAASPMIPDRIAAAHLLRATGDRQRLALLLKDEDPHVRANAVTALAGDVSPETIALLQLALIDEVADVRLAAVRALGAAGNCQVTESLLLLLNDIEPRVRRGVLQALGALRDQRAIIPLVDFMKNASGSLLIKAMESLVATAGPDAAPYLEPYIASDDEEIVKTVINLLSVVSPALLVGNLDRLLSHPHWEVRSRTLHALADAQGGDARPLLERARERESDPLVRDHIERLLERML